MRPFRCRTRALVAAAAAAVLSVAAFSAVPAGADVSHQLIQGSGSSWSGNAVNQWIADVQANGLQVVFTASGSAQGRKDFGYRSTDFAISDIGFQGRDPLTNAEDTPQGRAFAYVPIVAGGTAFPYQIRDHGKLVRDLRLSGQTLAKIFTNTITNWNDPAITADNNGRVLPSLPIVPVVHSEGSGSTAQFTKYLATQFGDLWRSFAGQDVATEYFPRKGQAIAQNGADGVMNFVSSAGANGSIGYNEYSYALAKNYPVAKIQNKAGYYILPNQYNVAVALTQAVINTDKSSPNYLLQDLGKVYVYSDPRTYPLSSYSYGIIPTAADDSKLKTTAGRQTLADFLYYAICDGQKETGPIGYSPLPVNLVQAGFDQIAKLKQADPAVDLTQRDVSTCRNPTFIAGQPQRNYLAEIAPQPAACDQAGQGPCTDTVDKGLTNPPSSGGGPSGGGGAGGSGAGGGGAGGGATASRGSTGGGAGAGNRATGAGASATGGPAAAATVGPSGAAGPSPSESASGGSVSDVPLAILPQTPVGATRLLPPLVALLLLFVVIGPPILIRLFTIRPKEDA